MSTMPKPSDGEELVPPTISPNDMPAKDQEAPEDEDAEQAPSEVAMRINLLGRLVIPPSNP